MNKKVKTYVLLGLVGCIWGLIGYNIYSYTNPSIELTEPIIHKSSLKGKKNESTKALEISNYRDPFLGRIVNNKKKKKAIQPKATIIFPATIYHGLVDGNNVKSYIISVNNLQEVYKIGDSFNNVKLISANSKEIVVEFQGVRKQIKRQQ